MDKKINKTLEELNQLNKERIFWLRTSAFVAISFLIMIVCWGIITEFELTNFLFSLGITISIFWWYWTMRFIRQIIGFKAVETTIIVDIIRDIKEVKEEIKKFSP